MFFLIAVPLSIPASLHAANAQEYLGFHISSASRTYLVNGTESAFEVRVSSNASAFSVLSIFTSLDSTSEHDNLQVDKISLYDHLGNSYGLGSDQSWQSNNSKEILYPQQLPVSLPAGGSLGITVIVSNATVGSSVDITFVYAANSRDAVTVEVISKPTMPLDVVDNYDSLEVTGASPDSGEILIDNSFTDPEIHCEICTRVDYRPDDDGQVSAAYVANRTDIGSFEKMSFWARGEGDVVFNVAGREQPAGGDRVLYDKNIKVSLDEEWKRVELDLSRQRLNDVTHLFGFTLNGTEGQTFYLKGMVYN